MGYTIGHLHGDEHTCKEITPNVAQRQRDGKCESIKRQRNKGEKHNTCLMKISGENRDNRGSAICPRPKQDITYTERNQGLENKNTNHREELDKLAIF